MKEIIAEHNAVDQGFKGRLWFVRGGYFWVASGSKSVSQGTKLASLPSKKQLRSLKRNFEWSSDEKDEKLEEDNISRSLFTTEYQPEEFTRW